MSKRYHAYLITYQMNGFPGHGKREEVEFTSQAEMHRFLRGLKRDLADDGDHRHTDIKVFGITRTLLAHRYLRTGKKKRATVTAS